jgi:thiopurine S-methyltransferase
MEPEFWHDRWRNGEIGFHKQDFNAHMMDFFDLLGLEQGDNILVPLCGKSRDMLWLRDRKFQVTGIEISPIAVADFFAENSIEYETQSHDWGTRYIAEGISILCADFFNVSSVDLPPVDGIYDRASLIALPEELRPQYVTHLAHLMPDTVRSLLITLEYPQHEMNGPPFSVSEKEVNRIYGDRFLVELLSTVDCLADEPRFQQQGLSSLQEHVFLLARYIT